MGCVALEHDRGGQARQGRGPRHPQLDKRLQAAYDMIPRCDLCADIGADHGRLSAVCLLSGKVRRMLVADISAQALDKARKRLEALGLADRAAFAVADGLGALDALPQGRVDALCALGMGGETIAGILRRGRDRLQGAALVVGPQTELALVRQTLGEIGYRIRREQAVEAAGRFYVLMGATPLEEGEVPHTRREVVIGTDLLMESGPQGRAFLARRGRLLQKAAKAIRAADAQKDRNRLLQLEEELGYLREVLSRQEDGQEFGLPIQK